MKNYFASLPPYTTNIIWRQLKQQQQYSYLPPPNAILPLSVCQYRLKNMYYVKSNQVLHLHKMAVKLRYHRFDMVSYLSVIVLTLVSLGSLKDLSQDQQIIREKQGIAEKGHTISMSPTISDNTSRQTMDINT